MFDGKTVSRVLISNLDIPSRLLICGTCAKIIPTKGMCDICNKICEKQPEGHNMLVDNWKTGKIVVPISPFSPLKFSQFGPTRKILASDDVDESSRFVSVVRDAKFLQFINEGKLERSEWAESKPDRQSRIGTASQRLFFPAIAQHKRVLEIQNGTCNINSRESHSSGYKPLRTYGGGQNRPHHIRRSTNRW